MISVTLKNPESVPHSKAVFGTMFAAGEVAAEVLTRMRRNRSDAGRPAKVGLFVASFLASSIRETGQNNLKEMMTDEQRRAFGAVSAAIGIGRGVAQIADGEREGSNRQIAYGAVKIAFGSMSLGSIVGRIMTERGSDTFTIDPQEIKRRFNELADTARFRLETLRRA